MDKLKRFIAFAAIVIITFNCIAQIPYDKKMHIGAGAAAGIWGTFAGNSLNFKPEGSALFGIGSVIVAGVGKETYDYLDGKIFKTGNYFDVKDLGATIIGGVAGVGLTYLGLKIFYQYKPQIFIGNVQNNLTIGLKFTI